MECRTIEDVYQVVKDQQVVLHLNPLHDGEVLPLRVSHHPRPRSVPDLEEVYVRMRGHTPDLDLTADGRPIGRKRDHGLGLEQRCRPTHRTNGEQNHHQHKHCHQDAPKHTRTSQGLHAARDSSIMAQEAAQPPAATANLGV